MHFCIWYFSFEIVFLSTSYYHHHWCSALKHVLGIEFLYPKLYRFICLIGFDVIKQHDTRLSSSLPSVLPSLLSQDSLLSKCVKAIASSIPKKDVLYNLLIRLFVHSSERSSLLLLNEFLAFAIFLLISAIQAPSSEMSDPK